MPEALFLDAGNTVVFLDHGVVRDVLADQGVHIPAGVLREAEGAAKRDYTERLRAGGSHEDGWTTLVSQMLAGAGAPPDRIDALTGRLREVHDGFNLWRRVPDGLREALDRARDAGIRLAVISNSEGHLDALFDRLGLADAFETVVDSALEGVRKPDPEIFRRALARLGVAADRSCYAGDLPEVDVEGARAAGLDAVLVDPYGFFADYDQAPRVASVAELIDRWLSGDGR